MIPDLQLEPEPRDYEDAIAVLIRENESLKMSAKIPTGEYGRREFTRDVLSAGRLLGPNVFMTGAGKLCVRLSS